MIVDLLAWNKLPFTLVVEEKAVEKNKEQCVNCCARHWQSGPAQRQWYSRYRKLGSSPEVQSLSRAWLKSAFLITGLTESIGALNQSASNMLRTLNTVTHFVHNPQGHTRNPQTFFKKRKVTSRFTVLSRIPLVDKGEMWLNLPHFKQKPKGKSHN